MERDEPNQYVKRIITLPDGRYLIYYDFPAPGRMPAGDRESGPNEPEER
jgi:hypothetical protein